MLLVEDNPSDADLVRALLTRIRTPRFKLDHVQGLDHALSALETEHVDVVLLDLELPDSSGMASIRRILATHPQTPIVVLTGVDDDRVGMRAVQEGAQDFLVKGSFDGSAAARSLFYAIERARLQNQMRRIVTRNVDAMVVVGPDGTVRFANQAAELLFARNAEDLVGSSFEHPLENKSSTEIEISHQREGEPKLAQMRVAEVEWDGQPAFLASIRDITDLRRTQELERRLMHANRLTAIGQLAAGVAHEINNPAAFVQVNIGVLGNEVREMRTALRSAAHQLEAEIGPHAAALLSSVLNEHDMPAKLATMEEVFDECLVGVKRIATTVKDLGCFSRIEEDDVDVVDLNDVVNVACSMTFNEVRHHAELIKELGDIPVIAADRAKVTQVLINLIINATHAIEQGDSTHNSIRVSTQRRNGAVIVAVEDTGCGIPERDLERIFEPFFTTKSRERGTGLGLSISAETIRKHGGDMRVESTVGRGSRFEVEFPERTGLRTNKSASRIPSLTSMPPRRARVLVIDDERMLRKAVRRVLEPTHEVVEAQDGAEGLEILAHGPAFDVVICDLMMPGVDGVGVHESLSRSDPKLLERFVFVTGGAFTTRARSFISNAQPTVLEKPVSTDLIRGIVRRLSRAQ